MKHDNVNPKQSESNASISVTISSIMTPREGAWFANLIESGGDRIRTCDLEVMSLASYRAAPPRVSCLGCWPKRASYGERLVSTNKPSILRSLAMSTKGADQISMFFGHRCAWIETVDQRAQNLFYRTNLRMGTTHCSVDDAA